MNWISASWEWIKSHPAVSAWLTAASLLMFLATPLVVAAIVIRLPSDYFAADRTNIAVAWARHSWLRPILLVTKNLVGVLLVATGFIMLFTPGQGLLTIAVGLVLVNFPGKR